MRGRARINRRQGGGESAAYLRSATPVRVRLGLWGWVRLSLRWMLIALIILGLGLSVAYSVDSYLQGDPRFALAVDGGGLHVTGLRHLAQDKVLKVFAADFGLSIAAVPLEKRHFELIQIPWVEQAVVLRIWPNQLWIHVSERRPVAFVRLPEGDRDRRVETAKLVDRAGVFLEPPAGADLSLPVVSGITEVMPLTERRKRLALFEELMRAMDGSEPPLSPLLSEIDVSDPRNARVTTVHGDDVIDLQMGDEEFRHRYELFLRYIDGWRREFGTVRTVDLRFEGQVAVR